MFEGILKTEKKNQLHVGLWFGFSGENKEIRNTSKPTSGNNNYDLIPPIVLAV